MLPPPGHMDVGSAVVVFIFQAAGDAGRLPGKGQWKVKNDEGLSG